MDDHRTDFDDAAARGHEYRDVSARGAALFAVGLVASLIIIAGAVAWLFQILDASTAEEQASNTSPTAVAPAPDPRSPVASGRELARLRAWEDERLKSLEWVDAPGGIARIPIDDAIDAVAERGLPRWPQVADPQNVSPAQGTPGNQPRDAPREEGSR